MPPKGFRGRNLEVEELNNMSDFCTELWNSKVWEFLLKQICVIKPISSFCETLFHALMDF